jgi:NAD+ synthetase
MKIGLAQINPITGDLTGNVGRCRAAITTAAREGADLVVLPEMALPGCPPRDILFDTSFIEALAGATADLAEQVRECPPVLVGTVLVGGSRTHYHPGLYNAAVLLQNGEVQMAAAKRRLRSDDVFYEQRWFLPGSEQPPILIAGQQVGILLGGDLQDEESDLHPAVALRAAGAELLVVLSASPYSHNILPQRLQDARRAGLPLIYTNLCGANDELIFDGRSFVLDAEGNLVASLAGFAEEVRVVEVKHPISANVGIIEIPPIPIGGNLSMAQRDPPLPPLEKGGKHKRSPLLSPLSKGGQGRISITPTEPSSAAELFSALVLGVHDFVSKNRLERAFVGLSGGIDSATVAVIAAHALGPERVTAVAIPSRFTDPRSTSSAQQLAQALGIEFKVMALEGLHRAAESELGDLLAHGTGGENVQARLRALILLSLVNRYGGVLLNTSNKTELSLGYGTAHGDLVGTLCPIGDLTKPEVVSLARWINSVKPVIPAFILERPPSAELRPDQVDPFDYPTISPQIERLVQENRSNEILRRTENKRWQLGVVLRVSEKAFGTGRLIPITRR